MSSDLHGKFLIYYKSTESWISHSNLENFFSSSFAEDKVIRLFLVTHNYFPS